MESRDALRSLAVQIGAAESPTSEGVIKNRSGQVVGESGTGIMNDILTVFEVATRLRCSKAHVCNVINGRVKGVAHLPAIRLGRRMLVRVAALEAWLLESERGVL